MAMHFVSLKKIKKALFALVFTAIIVGAGAAQEGLGPYSKSINDSAEARSDFLTKLVTARWQGVVEFAEQVLAKTFGKVLVRVEKEADFFYVEFLNEKAGAFPLVATGSCIVQRNYEKVGLILGAKLFIADDPDSYLLIYPKNEKTLIDVVHYGVVVKQGLVYPSVIYIFIQKPLDMAIAMTKGSYDWSSVFPLSDEATAGLAAFAKTLEDKAVRGKLFGLARNASDAAKLLPELEKAYASASEIAKPNGSTLARSGDPRKSERKYEPFPAYSGGFPAWASKALVYDAYTKDKKSAYVLLAARKDGGSERLLVVPYLEKGHLHLKAYDEKGETTIDEFAARNAEATVRVLRFGSF